MKRISSAVKKGFLVNSIAFKNELRSYALAKEKAGENEDTENRKKIHKIILNDLLSGKCKEDIIAELSENEEFLKYEKYFEIWIEYQVAKCKNQKEDSVNKKEQEQEEER